MAYHPTVTVKLSFRAECINDVDTVINSIKKDPRCGSITSFSYKQEMFFPDVDVEELELTKEMPVDNAEMMKYITTKTEKEMIEAVLELIEKCPDCHTIYETINLKTIYTGDRSYSESYLVEYIKACEYRY